MTPDVQGSLLDHRYFPQTHTTGIAKPCVTYCDVGCEHNTKKSVFGSFALLVLLGLGG